MSGWKQREREKYKKAAPGGHTVRDDAERDPAVVAERLAERDAAYENDTRTPGEIWLGDPLPTRSALARKVSTTGS